MSHMPRTVRCPTVTGLRETGIRFVCNPRLPVGTTKTMDVGYVPVSKRTAQELQANADELRRMAVTATTVEVMKALLTLADRFAALAEKRRADENE